MDCRSQPQGRHAVNAATRVLWPGVVAALLLLALARPAAAQDVAAEAAADAATAPDALEPAVDTSEAPSAVVRRRSTGDGVMDELELDSTRVTGNQELPKVLYIVPWKQANLDDIVGRPVNTLLDEALEPVDRDVFKRQLAYYDDIYGDTDPAE